MSGLAGIASPITRRDLLRLATAAAVMTGVAGSLWPAPAEASAVMPLFRRCSFGAYTANAPYPTVAPHYALEATVKARLGRMSWFQDMAVPWMERPGAQAAASGHDVMIAWQPRDAGRPIGFREILAGRWDARLATFFRRAAAHPGSVILRPFWEMNSNGGTYSMNYSGPDRQVHSCQQFIATWRHLVRLQRSVGGARVKWFFCANGSDVGRYPMEAYYPGSAFVDELGFDTYIDNWAPWTSFEHKIAPMYTRLSRLDARLPMTIGELGCKESGAPARQSKASWSEEMFLCTKFPQLHHVSFFNARQELDWRLNSSHATLAVYRHYLPKARGGTPGLKLRHPPR